MTNKVRPIKASTIGIRVTDELYERLARIEKATGIKPASLGNVCLEAVATYFEANKEFSFPMHIVSKSDFEALQYYKQKTQKLRFNRK